MQQDEIGKKKPEEKVEKQGQNVSKGGDVEAGKVTAVGEGGALYPDMVEDPRLRWAFIRKVYLILAVQFLFTAAVAVTFNRVHPIPKFITTKSHASLAFFIVTLILPFVALFPMMHFRRHHPVNMVFLGIFTACISLSVGWASAVFNGIFLLEAASMTTAVLFSLSVYTFWAARRGHDFKFLLPFLLVSGFVLSLYLIIQICLPLKKTALSIYGCLATILYSGFIIFDTDNLIKRHNYDEYTCAAVSLYLDVVNLFMSMVGLSAFSF